MDVGNVVYSYKDSGKLINFKKSDLKYVKEIKAFHSKYKTKDIATNLFKDGFFEFIIKASSELRKIIEIEAFKNGNFKTVPNKVSLIYRVSLEKIEENRVEIKIVEYRASKQENGNLVGTIILDRDFTTGNGVDNIKSAAIIKEGINNKNVTIEGQVVLVRLAMALGGYILVKLDGEWEKLEKSIDEIDDFEEKIKRYSKENSELRLALTTKEEEYNKINEYQEKKILKLEQEAREQKAKIDDLEKRLEVLNSRLIKSNEESNEEIETIEETKIIKIDYLQEFKLMMADKKICFLGGNTWWQKKMLTEFSNAVHLENLKFDKDYITTADIVIINSNQVSHSFTDRVKNISQRVEVPFIYTSKNNIEKMAQELVEKYKDVIKEEK